MLERIKNKHDNIELDNLNNILLIISLIFIFISLIFVKNIFVIILIFIFIYELSSHVTNNKYVTFLSNFLGIFLLSYILIYFLELSLFKFDIKKVIINFIKVILFTNYFLIVFLNIKIKKVKILKSKNKNKKKYTFKELRKEKIKYFQETTKTVVDNYIKKNDISKKSDYYKVLNSNINNKAKNDLEEYVWINYLRFYKNRKYNRKNIFDRMNFIFILIHVIILLLAIFVR